MHLGIIFILKSESANQLKKEKHRYDEAHKRFLQPSMASRSTTSPTVEAIKASPAIAKFKFRIRNQWEDAGRNLSTVDTYSGAGQDLARPKPFVLEAHEPPVLLGKNTAANPVEHLLHASAACLTTSMVYHAAARGIHVEEVESSLEGDIDLHGFLC